jgi:NAD(P)H dehydrogenase (quinone)
VKSLVVLSHPEPSSFAAALAQTAVEVLDATLLDLYREEFDPRLSAADFTRRANTERLEPMAEHLHAVQTGTLAPDIARHVELLREADLLVLVQPMWWFSLPAMAKGWIDRTFVNGYAYCYPGPPPWLGPLNDKRALAVFTSSYEASDYGDGGRMRTVDDVLYPLLWGTLAYTGMQVLAPFMAYAADSVDDATRRGYLDELRARLEDVESEAPLDFAADNGPAH